MNGFYRRLVSAFLQNGGRIDGPGREARFQAFLRVQIQLLPPSLRRTARAALEADESIPYEDLAAHVSREEGQPVSLSTVRQRVSRSGRMLEQVIRQSRDQLRG